MLEETVRAVKLLYDMLVAEQAGKHIHLQVVGFAPSAPDTPEAAEHEKSSPSWHRKSLLIAFFRATELSRRIAGGGVPAKFLHPIGYGPKPGGSTTAKIELRMLVREEISRASAATRSAYRTIQGMSEFQEAQANYDIGRQALTYARISTRRQGRRMSVGLIEC
jgi:hypothetical protein